MLVKTGPKKFYGAHSPIGGKAAAAAAGFAKGVNFNGSTYIGTTTSTGLTTTNGKKWLVSFWFRAAAVPSGFVIYFENTFNDGLTVSRWATNGYYLNAQDSANENVASIFMPTTGLDDTGVWHHFMASADVTGTAAYGVAIDGVPIAGLSFGAVSANNINFATAHKFTIGGRNGGSLFAEGDMAELYIAHNQYLNTATPANVEKFRSPSGHPVDLGAAGATPTGVAPTCYFSVRAGGVANDFKTNRGTGGLTWQDGTAGGAGAGTLGLASVDP